MTSRTTAHLAPICDDGVSALIHIRGKDDAELFQRSQMAAVDRIEEHVNGLSVACNFRRLDGFLFPGPGMEESEARKQCDEEFDAAKSIGAPVTRAKGVPLKGYEAAPVLRYPNQATFHPLRYLKALTQDLLQRGGLVFADSPVVEIEEHDDSVTLTVERGKVVTAAHVVIATNSPISNRVKLHSKMAPYRTYAMAFTLPSGSLPDALYWDMADPYHYVRLNPGPGSIDYLIAGGADHKSGEVDDGHIRFEAIEAWIRRLVPQLGKVVHRWSGQVLDTTDYCAFIGRNPGSSRIFVATGDSGQGMTHGVVASLLLRDLITTDASPWEKLYDPARMPPATFGNFVRENLTAVQNLAEYVTPGELSGTAELAPGQGGILRKGLSKLAVCRDLSGRLHVHSATCTHLGCLVHWNSTEQCWDCPCHGSQFAPDGAVLNGPAIYPLQSGSLQRRSNAA
jgi:glycine/D-amino acid oxidase-like deaminating enzyme/nitrite reductase/ring-hydroxylating ferredoxin subunit